MSISSSVKISAWVPCEKGKRRKTPRSSFGTSLSHGSIAPPLVKANRPPLCATGALQVRGAPLRLTFVSSYKGSWFSRLWSSWYGDRELKIIIIGLNNAGKTTILYKLLLDEVVVTTPTIGSNVEEITYKNLKFFCWDIGGQNALRQSWSNYFADTDAIIYVVDSSDKDRLGISKEELLKTLKHEGLESTLILVLANKNDVKDALSSSEISDALGLSQIQTHQWHIQSCCALTGEGLHTGMDWIAQRIESSKS